MTRAATIYVLTIGLCAAALWAILAIGPARPAPPDVSGDWVLETTTRGETGPRPIRLSVEQSGQFLRLRVEKGAAGDFRLSPVASTPPRRLFELRGPACVMHVEPAGEGARLDVKVIDCSAIAPAGTYAARRRADPAEGPPPAAQRAERGSAAHLIFLLLLQTTVILAFSQIMGQAFAYLKQPKVTGEMIAGIMLGPSFFGLLFPGAAETLFAPETLRYLGVFSQLGVIFFLFLVGLELDPRLIRHRGHTAVVVSHVSIVAPFMLGGLLALYLYPILFHDTPRMRFSSVTLFMGAAMSITAFPVLARILTERNLHRTPVGAVSITCAAVDDVTAWCILAFVVGFARAEGMGRATLTAMLAAAYVLVMFFVVRPLLARLQRVYDRQGRLSRPVTAVIFLLVLASAGATEAIGIHALFGAFLMGALMPKGTRFVRELNEKLEDFTVVLLLPIFFAYTGMQTRIGLLNSVEVWGLALLVILTACAGKFGGSTLAARACGLDWRESSAIGILMNTRGLMQLVILGIGRELGVVTDAVFAMMVIMALFTTLLTTPVLDAVYPDRLLRRARAGARPAEGVFTLLLPVSLPRSAPPLLRLADMITGPDDQRRRIVALHLRPAAEHEAYRSAAGDASEERPEPLETISRQGVEMGVPVETVALVSHDPASAIAAVAEEERAALVLMGFHNPVIGQAILGGTVHRVLRQARADVAIFVDRGMHAAAKTILVPYLGSPHDQLALQLAARMARNARAAVTVLHVVPPRTGAGRPAAERLGAKTVTERVFADPTQPAPVTFMVIEHTDPISAVLEQAKPFDLVVIGVAAEWGLSSHLFGWKAERIARDCPTPLLITRRHLAGP